MTTTDTTRDRRLDLLATGYRCTKYSCGAEVDETCRTPHGKPTAPHQARIDRAVKARVKTRSAMVDYGVLEVSARVDITQVGYSASRAKAAEAAVALAVLVAVEG